MELNGEILTEVYTRLYAARQGLAEAEENRIAASITREKRYMEAINEAIADGITDPGRQQQKANRATREELTGLHLAEKATRAATLEYQLSGILVDCFVRKMELEKLVRQKD
jgi:hypothetical protein